MREKEFFKEHALHLASLLGVVALILRDAAADEAALVRAKERVLVAGIITKHEKTLNDGSVKETRFFHPQCVIPLDRLLEVMLSGVRMGESQAIKELLDKDEEDAFESAGDFEVVDENDDRSVNFDNLFV